MYHAYTIRTLAQVVLVIVYTIEMNKHVMYAPHYCKRAHMCTYKIAN